MFLWKVYMNEIPYDEFLDILSFLDFDFHATLTRVFI